MSTRAFHVLDDCRDFRVTIAMAFHEISPPEQSADGERGWVAWRAPVFL
jgi:hypothetical protein